MSAEATGLAAPLDLRVQTADPVHVQIERHLRHQIVSGRLAAGTRLPSTAKLAQRWGVDTRAVQRAVTPLAAQGLLDRCRGRGTFVQAAASKPLVAIVLGPALTNESAHYYRAALEALREETRGRGWASRVYDGLNPATEAGQPQKDETIRHLENDIRNGGFKGTIHLGLRGEVSLAVEATCGLPIVREDLMVKYDVAAFVKESATYLAGRGCRRLVMICKTPDPDPEAVSMENSARLKSLLTATQGQSKAEVVSMPWLESTAVNEAETHRRMLSRIDAWLRQPETMPDGLIVDDDIMMRSVALALIARSAQVPRKMRVVTLATDWVRLHYGMPVVRYEFPVGGMAQTLVGLLWKKLANEPLPALPIILAGRLRGEE